VFQLKDIEKIAPKSKGISKFYQPVIEYLVYVPSIDKSMSQIEGAPSEPAHLLRTHVMVIIRNLFDLD